MFVAHAVWVEVPCGTLRLRQGAILVQSPASLFLLRGDRGGAQTEMGATRSKQPVSWAHCAGTTVDFHEQEMNVGSVEAQRFGDRLVLHNPPS